MTEEFLNIDTDLEAFIREGRSFAFYRIPGEKKFSFLTQSTNVNVQTYQDIKDLNGTCGFIVAPFRVTENCPVVLIQPDEVMSYDLPMGDVQNDKEDTDHLLWSKEEQCFDDYQSCFTTFIKALHGRRFDKLVLSRSQTIQRDSSFGLLSAFFTACGMYTHSYVYLAYTPQTGVWLGSTPEVLLSGERLNYYTMALAGTQSIVNGVLPDEWDEKNRQEQEFVAQYIRKQLHSLGILPHERGPFPAFAGTLSHLKTEFDFCLSNEQLLGDLLALLHPTPAVCGLPKESAYQFILDHEGYDRRYYSGFVGWLNPKGKTDIYVNLRCMQIGDKELTLYAGGGLLASSDLADEWTETEKKLQTMKRISIS